MHLAQELKIFLKEASILKGKPNSNFSGAEGDFSKLLGYLVSFSHDDLVDFAQSNIPDTREGVLVEFGSGHGADGTGLGGIIGSKKALKTILISDVSDHPFDSRFNREMLTGLNLEDRVKESMTIKDLYPIEYAINQKYSDRRHHNMEFHYMDMKSHRIPVDEVVSKEGVINITRAYDWRLPHFLKGHSTLDFFFLGNVTPNQLPFLKEMYDELIPAYVCVSVSGTPKPADDLLDMVQSGLNLTDEERKGFRDSMKIFEETDSSDQTIQMVMKYAITQSFAKESFGGLFGGKPFRNDNSPDYYSLSRTYTVTFKKPVSIADFSQELFECSGIGRAATNFESFGSTYTKYYHDNQNAKLKSDLGNMYMRLTYVPNNPNKPIEKHTSSVIELTGPSIHPTMVNMVSAKFEPK